MPMNGDNSGIIIANIVNITKMSEITTGRDVRRMRKEPPSEINKIIGDSSMRREKRDVLIRNGDCTTCLWRFCIWGMPFYDY